MPNPKQLPSDYNWSLTYSSLVTESASLQQMYPDELMFSQKNLPMWMNVDQASIRLEGNKNLGDSLFDSDNARRGPSLIVTQPPEAIVSRMNESQVESAQTAAANANILREKFSGFYSALYEKQIELAKTNPEGASLLRSMAERAMFALRGYGSEAANDAVFSIITSQLGTIH